MRFDIQLEGDEELLKMFERASGSKEVQRALGQAIYGFGTQVLNESKKLVPVDTGNLRSSGQVSRPKISGDTIEVEITYGGPGAQYALVVHEDTTLDHSPTKRTAITKRPRRGQAKYLETPFMAQAPTFVRNIAARYAAYFRRGA